MFSALRIVVVMTLLMFQISAFKGFARGSRGIVGGAVKMASTSVAGDVGTDSYRLFFKDGDKTISPWHDIVSRILISFVSLTHIYLFFNERCK